MSLLKVPLGEKYMVFTSAVKYGEILTAVDGAPEHQISL
jgi:hypothetical protein